MKRRKFMNISAMNLLIFSVLHTVVSACTNEGIEINDETLTLAKRMTRSVTEWTYPTVDEILSDPLIEQKANDAWQSCKARITDSCRTEYGFNIYCKGPNLYSTSHTIHGPIVIGIDTTSCSFIPPSCNNTERQELCAIFHTHTSLAFFPPTMYRKVGPSRSDTLYERKHKIPLLTRDYIGGRIYGGESPEKEYKDYICELSCRPLY